MAELTRYGFYIRPSDGSNQFHEAEDGSYCLYSAAMEEIERLRAVLRGAVEVIKTWHNMSRIGLRGDPTLEAVWDIYWRCAPEMKPIREALAGVETPIARPKYSGPHASYHCPCDDPACPGKRLYDPAIDDRPAVETAAVQSDAEIEAELAMDRRIFGTAYYRRVNGRKERIPPQELFICTEQQHAEDTGGRFDRKRFEQAPCYLCGYNGEGYYSSNIHPCAAIYHGMAPKGSSVETTEGRPWYLYHQWGQDNDYKWYQSCHCRKCADSTAAIAKAQERATLLAEKAGEKHGV